MRAPAIYVETVIQAEMEDLWRHTQTPDLHQRWDLRFTDISYLPRPDPAEPQRFSYQTHIGFGLHVSGEGESTGTVERNGTRTSALRFWSDDRKSLIRAGSGYWQYVPTEGGVRFLTRYDYETRFGIAGSILDCLVFRPLLGWATAWSFDRLRLWLESGLDSRTAAARSLVDGLARWALGAIWMYQGLVPKLLAPESGELDLLRASGLFHGNEPLAIALIGGAEIALGMFVVWPRRFRWPLVLTLGLLPFLLAAAVMTTPASVAAPFNAPTLCLAMAALAAIGLVQGRDVPMASRCRRRSESRLDARP